MQIDQRPEPTPEAAIVLPTADAYVRPVMQDGRLVYSIHDQNGQALAVAATRDMAFAFLGQHELDGVDAH